MSQRRRGRPGAIHFVVALGPRGRRSQFSLDSQGFPADLTGYQCVAPAVERPQRKGRRPWQNRTVCGERRGGCRWKSAARHPPRKGPSGPCADRERRAPRARRASSPNPTRTAPGLRVFSFPACNRRRSRRVLACRESRPEAMSATAILPFPLLPSLAEGTAEPVPSGVLAMATLPDQTLLERVVGGDADAFAALYRRYERPVFGMLAPAGGWPSRPRGGVAAGGLHAGVARRLDARPVPGRGPAVDLQDRPQHRAQRARTEAPPDPPRLARRGGARPPRRERGRDAGRRAARRGAADGSGRPRAAASCPTSCER